jgi:iron complex outermembrane receptor protein
VLRPRLFWDNKNGGTAVLTGGITYENRSGGTIPGSVLPATGQPYKEALKTARYDLGGNVQWVLGGRYILTTRFAASDQDHRHQFGEDVEKDRHDLLFGEASLRGTQVRTPGLQGLPIKGTDTALTAFPVSPTPTWCQGSSGKTTSKSPRG